MRPRLIDVVVRQIRPLAPRVREYLLCTTDGNRLPPFDAGAHIELHVDLPASGPVVRHYSLVGGEGLRDDPPDTYRIAIQREDRPRGSAFLHESLVVGSTLRISAPLNNFAIDRRAGKRLLIAGGIGVTPILSMLRSVVRRGVPFECVYAGRTRDDMAYVDAVEALAGPCGQVHVGGHVDFPALLARQPADTQAYVCGPRPMIAAVRAAAEHLGWPATRVRSELFTAAPTGDETAFDVVLQPSGQRVHVGSATTILDALHAAGLHPLHDCRRGECGLCPMTVVEADGPLVHQDSYLSDAERASQKTLCICVSRLQGLRLVLQA